MTPWLQCNAWPLASIRGSGCCLCVSTSSEAECAPETEALKRASDVIFVWCQSVALQFSAPHDGVIIAHETVIHESFFIFYFFAEWMKRTKTQSGEWYKTRFNGNTQQKLSSLQTCHSVLHCVCEDFPKLRCTFLCCTTTTTTIMGSIAAGRLVCEETLRRLVFLDRKISFSICFVPRAASVSDWCSL